MVTYDSSVLFVNNSEVTFDDVRIKKDYSCLHTFKMHLCVPPGHMPKRILAALAPPIFSRQRFKVYVDLLGPVLAVLMMAAILQCGHGWQAGKKAFKLSPGTALLIYCTLMPVTCFILGKLGRASVGFTELVSILGYALYGHVFTLTVSLAFCDENSDWFFFMCLTVFGGLSSLRLVLVLVSCIPKPAVRFVICSFVCIAHLLFLIFLHFAYMHKTFVYGGKKP